MVPREILNHGFLKPKKEREREKKKALSFRWQIEWSVQPKDRV